MRRMTLSLFKFAKKNKEPVQPHKCKTCDADVIPTPSQKWKLKNKVIDGVFCSRNCRAKSQQRRHTDNCKVCGKEVTRLMSQVRKSISGNIFCGPQCGSIWSNWQGPKFNNPSKLEIDIVAQLHKDFPKLKIKTSDNQVIGSQLDIWIPKLNLAIEINGPHHFMPLRGEVEKYLNTLKNDIRKWSAARDAGIKLYVLNSSEQKGKAAFERYYPQVKKLVESFVDEA